MESFLCMIFFILVCNILIRGSASTIPEKIPQKNDQLDGNISPLPAVFLLYNSEVKPAGKLGDGCTKCNGCKHGCQRCDTTNYCCCASQINNCCTQSDDRHSYDISVCGICDADDSRHNEYQDPKDGLIGTIIISVVITCVGVTGLFFLALVLHRSYLQVHAELDGQPNTETNITQYQQDTVASTYHSLQQPQRDRDYHSSAELYHNRPGTRHQQDTQPVASTYRSLQQPQRDYHSSVEVWNNRPGSYRNVRNLQHSQANDFAHQQHSQSNQDYPREIKIYK